MDSFSAPQLVARFETLRSDRGNWESIWDKVAKYCLPDRAIINKDQSEGQALPSDVYDTTAIQSCGFLAAGLQGHLTSPSQKWFSLTFPDKELKDDEEVTLWLRDSADQIYNTLNASNFNHQVHACYQDLSAFGTAALHEDEHPSDIVRFDCRPISEIFIVEDATGKVTGVFRFYKLTVEQAFNLYGNNAGKEVLEKHAKREYEAKIEYLEVIGVRNVREIGKLDKKNKPIFHKIISYKDKTFVSEGGYDEMPIFVPRWDKNSINRYGYSPAMKCYGDIKTANEIKKDLLDGAAKVVNPPIDAPHEGYLLPLDLQPGGINYRNTMDPNERIKQLDIQPNIPVGNEMLEQERQNIKQAFYVDLFLLMERANMTATEVVQRSEEKMILLGPVLGRLQNELLDNVINRTFSILRRRGIIKTPPAKVLEYLEKSGDVSYVVRYEGRLAKMQRHSEAASTQAWLGLMGQIAQAKPEVLDNINEDEIAKDSQEYYGVNPKYLRKKEEVDAMRQQRAKLQEMQMRLQAMSASASMAKDAGAAAKGFSDSKSAESSPDAA